MPLYDYHCPQGHATEALKPHQVTAIECACGETAQRQGFHAIAFQIGEGRDWSSPVRDGMQIRTPVAERKVKLGAFLEASEQLAYEHERAEESAQRALPKPSLWNVAKRRAKKLEAAGIKDSKDYDPRFSPK